MVWIDLCIALLDTIPFLNSHSPPPLKTLCSVQDSACVTPTWFDSLCMEWVWSAGDCSVAGGSPESCSERGLLVACSLQRRANCTHTKMERVVVILRLVWQDPWGVELVQCECFNTSNLICWVVVEHAQTHHR